LYRWIFHGAAAIGLVSAPLPEHFRTVPAVRFVLCDLTATRTASREIPKTPAERLSVGFA